MAGLAGAALLTNFFVKAYTLDIALDTEQGFAGKKKITDAEEKITTDSEEKNVDN